MENTINLNEIEKVSEVLKENEPEQEIESMNNAKELASQDHDDIEDILTVGVDENGHLDTVKTTNILYNDTLSLDEIDDDKLEELNKEKFEDAVKSIAKMPEINISDEDALQLLNAINMYKNKESNNKVYNNLPQQFKNAVNSMYLNAGGKISRGKVISFILDNFIAEANIEKEFVDFQKTMEQTLDIPTIMDMYSEHIKDLMETKTLESADRLEEAGEAKKADLLRKVSKSFTDTYTFTSLCEFLHSDRKARNHITKDVKNYAKFCRNFNYKNENSKFAISDVDLMRTSLETILTDVDSDDIKKFIILFCKRCESLNSNDVVDCSYMYYFIKNIITLNYIDEAKTTFSITLINNIKSTINKILKVEADHKIMMESLKKNKKK